MPAVAMSSTRWRTAVFLPTTSGAWWRSSMRFSTSAVWKRPSSTLRKALTDFWTKCPEVHIRPKASTSRCWPLPCFNTFYHCMGGILCRRRSNMKVKSKRLFSEIGRSPSKISPPFFPRRSWKSTTARSSGGCLTCSASMPGSGGRPESSLL